ncbi:hypothetical protein HRbin30_02361 [bacterium HR30]|nr:hypothetical protein HRbin30_02361 [bacterium HR30]
MVLSAGRVDTALLFGAHDVSQAIPNGSGRVAKLLKSFQHQFELLG